MAIELFEMQTKISDALLRLEQLGESLWPAFKRK